MTIPDIEEYEPVRIVAASANDRVHILRFADGSAVIAKPGHRCRVPPEVVAPLRAALDDLDMSWTWPHMDEFREVVPGALHLWLCAEERNVVVLVGRGAVPFYTVCLEACDLGPVAGGLRR